MSIIPISIWSRIPVPFHGLHFNYNYLWVGWSFSKSVPDTSITLSFFPITQLSNRAFGRVRRQLSSFRQSGRCLKRFTRLRWFYIPGNLDFVRHYGLTPGFSLVYPITFAIYPVDWLGRLRELKLKPYQPNKYDRFFPNFPKVIIRLDAFSCRQKNRNIDEFTGLQIPGYKSILSTAQWSLRRKGKLPGSLHYLGTDGKYLNLEEIINRTNWRMNVRAFLSANKSQRTQQRG